MPVDNNVKNPNKKFKLGIIYGSTSTIERTFGPVNVGEND